MPRTMLRYAIEYPHAERSVALGISARNGAEVAALGLDDGWIGVSEFRALPA
ncbi:MAG: hypothetical protein M3P91_04370 [Actinomycetota bacterium]|nr:hypothetical protein [Actinomycetota bacterium]